MAAASLTVSPGGLHCADTAGEIENYASSFYSQVCEQQLYMLYHRVCPLGDGTLLLLFCIHHLCVDAFSMSLLVSELSQRYACRLGAYRFAPHATDNFTAWLAYRESRRDEELRCAREYWAPHLKDHPHYHSLPPPVTVGGPGAFTRPLDEPGFAQLAGLAASSGCTLFMLMQCLFSLTVCLCSGARKLVTVSPCARRYEGRPGCPDLSGTIGNIAGLVCISFCIEEQDTVQALFVRTRNTILDAFDNTAADFADVVEAVAPLRQGLRNPLAQILFTHRNVPEVALSFEDCCVGQVYPYSDNIRLELEVELVTQGKAGAALHWAFDGKHVSRAQAADLSNRFCDLLALGTHPGFMLMTVNDVMQQAGRIPVRT